MQSQPQNNLWKLRNLHGLAELLKESHRIQRGELAADFNYLAYRRTFEFDILSPRILNCHGQLFFSTIIKEAVESVDKLFMPLEEIVNLITDLGQVVLGRPAREKCLTRESPLDVLVLNLVHPRRLDKLLKVIFVTALKALILSLSNVDHVERGAIVPVVLLPAVRALNSCPNFTTSIAHERLLLELFNSLPNIHPLVLLLVVESGIARFKAVLVEVELRICECRILRLNKWSDYWPIRSSAELALLRLLNHVLLELNRISEEIIIFVSLKLFKWLVRTQGIIILHLLILALIQNSSTSPLVLRCDLFLLTL